MNGKRVTRSKLINNTNVYKTQGVKDASKNSELNQVLDRNEKNKSDTLQRCSIDNLPCGDVVNRDIDIQSTIENKENHVSNDNLNSTEKHTEPYNNFTVDSLNTSENILPNDQPVVVGFMDSVVQFEPPKGLQHISFELNTKNDIASGSNLFLSNLSQITKEECDESFANDSLMCNGNPKTPVMSFKERENVQAKTPTSTPKRLTSLSRRNSMTPNPKNFLHKTEDPIATAKVETPKPMVKETSLPDSVLESVRHFESLVTAEEEKFITSLEKWEKIQQEDIAPLECEDNF